MTKLLYVVVRCFSVFNLVLAVNVFFSVIPLSLCFLCGLCHCGCQECYGVKPHTSHSYCSNRCIIYVSNVHVCSLCGVFCQLNPLDGVRCFFEIVKHALNSTRLIRKS